MNVTAARRRGDRPADRTRTADEYHDQLDDLETHPRVALERDVKAMTCGATGCRTPTTLVRSVIEGFGQRVLCLRHTVQLVQREVLDAR